MPELSHAQAIECFHLAFLNVLPRHARRDRYVIKGGANLRYFFKSLRYSEDIDFDAILTGDGWRLTEQVDAALASKALQLLLRQHDIAITNINNSKQTETTRKWKLLLSAPGQGDAISTKIEFSLRNGETRFVTETVDKEIADEYHLLSPSLQRYLPAPATIQKVVALARRHQVQARDVFDLNLLFTNHPNSVAAGEIGEGDIAGAEEQCVGLSFDAFDSQVVPFLDPPIAEIYGSRDVWEQMQANVLEELIKLHARN